MSTEPAKLPPHYHALRLVWTVLQLALLLVLAVVVVQVAPPGDVVGDVADWSRDLQRSIF